MKNDIITTIEQAMLKKLDNAQLQELHAILVKAFKGVTVTAVADADKAPDNTEILEEFLSAKRIEGCSEKSLNYYRKTITAALDNIGKGIKHITTDDLRAYLTNYQAEKKSSKVTMDNIRRILSSFFSWLEDEDYIIKSPVRRIHKVKTSKTIKETYTDENLELMRDNCVELRDLAMIDMLASTGMRVGEMVLLNRSDIDFNERECVVVGKGDKERMVYFDARTKLHLQSYLDSRTDSDPALFVSLRSPHKRLTIGAIELRLREMGRKLGINKVHPHKFRRTLATISADDYTPQQIRNLVNIFASKEDFLWDALQVSSARSGYCAKADKQFVEELNRKKPKTMEKIKELWYHGNMSEQYRHYSNFRYRALNLHSFFQHEIKVINSRLRYKEPTHEDPTDWYSLDNNLFFTKAYMSIFPSPEIAVWIYERKVTALNWGGLAMGRRTDRLTPVQPVQ